MDTSVVIISCDKNEDLFKPFFKLYNKYFKNNFETYIITETIDCKYANTIKEVGSWTTRVRKALKKIPTKKVIILLDDFFIRQQVDIDRLNYAINSINENIACFNFEKTYDTKDTESQFKGFLKRQNKSMYLCSCQPSVWNKDILIEYLQKDITPHEWELQILDTKYDHYINSQDFIIDIGYSDKNRTHWGLVQRKWTKDVEELFKKENIEVDYSKRGWFL